MDRSPEAILAGFGGALMDTVVPLSEEEFSRAALPVERGSARRVPAEIFRELLGRLPEGRGQSHPGGSVCNTLRTAAERMRKTRLFSAVGNDDAGGVMRASLMHAGVDISPVEILSGAMTDCCLAIVTPDGERTMLSCIDAGTHFPAGQLRKELLSDVSLFHFEGYALRFPEVVSCILELLPESCGASIDLGSPDLIRGHRPYLQQLLQMKKLRFLFGNRSEFSELTRGASVDDIAAAVAGVAHGELQCVMTDGARGATWFDLLGHRCFSPAERVPSVVDTVGAGDAFMGGFLSAILTGDDVCRALQCGAHAAACVVMKCGG